MNNPAGYLLIAILAFGVAIMAAETGLKGSMVVVGAIFMTPMVLACLLNMELGIMAITLAGFFLSFAARELNTALPIGLLLDSMLLLLFLGLLIQRSLSKDWSFANNRVSIMIVIWLVYSLSEVLNPDASSRMAWLYTVRSMAGFLLLFFIALYACGSWLFIKRITFFFIALSSLAAIYGLKQEYVGLSARELEWLYSDPKALELIVQWGRIRIFSIFSDPTTFGVLMSYMGLFCYILVGAMRTNKARIALVLAGSAMMMGSAYSGTRTAYALIPAGVFFFTFISLNRKVIALCLLFFVFGGIAMTKSTGNPIVARIQSAFQLKNDASMQLRLNNQAYIQPFIQTHPFGGGLGSTGMWGVRFSPNSMLAQFPPDSGYVRTAVEQGWIGLLLYCTLIFMTFFESIRRFVRVRHPVIKSYYWAYLTLFFCLALANYPQEAIILLPNSMIFYTSMAVLMRLHEFDDPELIGA